MQGVGCVTCFVCHNTLREGLDSEVVVWFSENLVNFASSALSVVGGVGLNCVRPGVVVIL